MEGGSGVTSAMILCRVGRVNAQIYVRQHINKLSDNMDCTEVDNEQRWNDTARCLKHVGKKLGYSAMMWPSLRCMVGHKYRLNPGFFGATGCITEVVNHIAREPKARG